MKFTNRLSSLTGAALFLALVFVPASVALAVPNVKIGDYFANPGDPVNVTATVTGGDPIAGVFFAIGTGPFRMTPGNPDTTTIGPTISNLDVHWLFVGNESGPLSPLSFLGGRKMKNSDVTIAGSVPAVGTLATFTLNTQGVPLGVYELRIINMSSTSGGNTSFVLEDASTVTPTTDSGHLFLGLPEPSTLLLGLIALAGLSVMAIRNERRRRIAQSNFT